MSKSKLISRSKQKSKYGGLRKKNNKVRITRSSEGEINKLEDHPFYQNILKYGLIPIWEENRKAKKKKQEFKLNNELTYHFNVFQYAGALFEAIKRLNDIPFFINQNPNLKLLENMNVTTQEWFVYHYANYCVIACGIFDTVLLVINDVLQLGFKPNKCTRKDVFSQAKVIGSNINPLLDKLDRYVEKYRTERNKYAHRSEHPDFEFVDNLNAYRLLKEAKEKGLFNGQLPKLTMAHLYFFEQRDKKTAELKVETTEICDAIIELLDVLNPLYVETFNSFPKKEEHDFLIM